MASFKVSDKLMRSFERKITNRVNTAITVLKKEIDLRTPEDTKELLSNNRITLATKIGTKIGGMISNDTPYGPAVEFGVGNRAYNYNKPKGSIFFRGVGARMFTRGFDSTKSRLIDIIKNGG